ncbi:MAG: hypothetical protein V7K62_10100 [Nostoc sp.]
MIFEMQVVDCHGFNSALDVDVGWVERSATQLIIRMLGYAKPPPNKAIFLLDEFLGSQKNEIYADSNIVWSLIPNTVVPNASIFHNGIRENSLTNVIEALDRTQIGIGEC